ncbi:DUF6602 domain-containing protein [Seramator thermalis]|uniref:DUF6602 domain-containing protein n=1 Tax=Seramator thermalis TaxID=2496270 RepID=UPI001EED4F46|nr:DUF6602 domain-containing protein [Seramator thermalis]
MEMKCIISSIKSNYDELERSIVSQLLLETPNHQLTTGTYRETIWMSLFKQIIPHKFSIKQGVFIMDSNGNTSAEVDLVIFDEQYTPYIFNYGEICFIPIEAVAVVIQCKSFTLDDKNLTAWVETINQLKTSNNSIARLANSIAINESVLTQKSTRPIKILCYLSEQNPDQKAENRDFDIELCAIKGESKLNIKFYDTVDNLYKAFINLNFHQPEDICEEELTGIDALKKTSLQKQFTVKDNNLLSFIFQLNQLLMLINNPLLFPHQSYVDLFNEQTDNENPS